MSSDATIPRLRVRWWGDSTSYAGVRDKGTWTFYEKEAGTVHWYELSSTPELVAMANAVLDEGKHVQELPPDDGKKGITQKSLQPEKSKPKVFICYAHQDQRHASRIFRGLTQAGFDPWMDKHSLVLGDQWEQEIKRAVAESNAFVPCLRPGFDEIGFRQQEVRWALDALRIRPLDSAFIVPFVVEPCKLPEWCKPFHAGDHLQDKSTFDNLIKALRKHCCK